MGLDGAAVLRALGERDLRLGPAFEIFPFFLRDSAWINSVGHGPASNGRASAAVPVKSL